MKQREHLKWKFESLCYRFGGSDRKQPVRKALSLSQDLSSQMSFSMDVAERRQIVSAVSIISVAAQSREGGCGVAKLWCVRTCAVLASNPGVTRLNDAFVRDVLCVPVLQQQSMRELFFSCN